MDTAGNVYVSDEDNHLVAKISPDGILTVVAGNGIPGFSGDGGPATSAAISFPSAVEVDAAGNLYIASRHAIRKVNPEGIISTVAGIATPGFSGDGGLAIQAQLNSP